MSECLNKQDSEYAKFWIWQCSQYANVTQRSEYLGTCPNKVLNISRVLNMQGFWYNRAMNMQELHKILNMSWYVCVGCSYYAWICLNLQ